MDIERRYYRAELRAVTESGVEKIVGYGAVFNSLSENLGGFQEMIMPGAFDSVLGGDIRALFNHDFNLLLGRTAAGTLKVQQDDIGLRYEIIPPDTSYARDLLTSIKRGDVDQSSFGFNVAQEEWDTQRLIPLRKVVSVGRLFDLGPVTIPAYPTTNAAVRDYANLLSRAAEREAGGDPAGRLDLLRRKLEMASRE